MKESLTLSALLAKLRQYLVPIVVAVVIGASFVLVGIPSVQSSLRLRKEVQAAQAELDLIEDKVASLEGVRESDMRAKLDIVEVALPSEKPVFSAISSVQIQAEQAGVTVTGFDFSPGSLATGSAQSQANSVTQVEEALPGQLAEMPMKIDIEGSYEVVTNYLDLLQRTTPLLAVTGLDLSLSSQEEALFSIGVEMVAYYSLPPEEITAPTEPLPPLDVASPTFSLLSSFDTAADLEIQPGSGQDKQNPFSF